MTERFTYSELSSVLRIDESGTLVWSVNRQGGARSGRPAGGIDRQGYISFEHRGAKLLAHRVIWLLTHGTWPSGMIDHIDGNKANNLPSNLRVCDNARNMQNAKSRSRTSFKGVALLRHGRYQAQCGKSYLGSFDTDVEAAKAYDAEASRRYGEFARLNFGSEA